MADGNAAYSSANGVLYNKNQTTLIQYPEGKTDSFTIPNSVTTIEERAFFGCSGLTSVTIPGSVATIRNRAFSGCSSLTSVTIPGSVTTIGWSAFSGCSGLTSVTISGSVTTIETYAFAYCRNLTSVTSLNTTPPNLGITVFRDVPTDMATLYVPQESEKLYKNATQWSAFNTIPFVTTSVATASTSAAKVYALAGTLYVEGAAQPYTVHSLTGAQVYVGTAPSLTLPSDMYVVRIGKERHKVVVR